jgi:DNA-binding NtrC family response regulator
MYESILVVDVDPDIRAIIRKTLKREGYRVACAERGEDALKLLHSKSFAVVVTDIRIPDIPGLLFLKRIRQTDDDVEIIVLSGFLTFQNVIGALRDGEAADYLVKPLNHMDELVDSVKKACRKRSVRKEQRALEKEIKLRNLGLELEIKHLRQRDTSLDGSGEE